MVLIHLYNFYVKPLIFFSDVAKPEKYVIFFFGAGGGGGGRNVEYQTPFTRLVAILPKSFL